jgi:hypothetical protein
MIAAAVNNVAAQEVRLESLGEIRMTRTIVKRSICQSHDQTHRKEERLAIKKTLAVVAYAYADTCDVGVCTYP